MNNSLKYSLSFIILLGFSRLVFAKNYTVSEANGKVIVNTQNYKIDLYKTSPEFNIFNRNKMILQSFQSIPFYFIKDGKEYKLLKLIKSAKKRDTLELSYRTSMDNVKAKIRMIFLKKHITFDITINNTCNELGCNFKLKRGIYWYGGNVTSAQHWPSNLSTFIVDPFYATSNQTSPIWFCSSGIGLFIPTYNTMGYSFNSGNTKTFSVHVKNTNAIRLIITVGQNITDAYREMIQIVGKPQNIPPKDYFSKSIFNSWIQFKKDVNQLGLLQYADNIRAHKIPCNIIEIDDKWTPRYGDFEFDSLKFPDPKVMVRDLRSKDFKVVLWVTPFVEKAASDYHFLASKGYLINNPETDLPYEAKWWNGTASLIDLSNPKAYNWFLQELKKLQNRYGIDGFKLDAGDAEFLNKPYQSFKKITPSQYTDLFASLGTYFNINELRVSWLSQSLGIVERLRDKSSDWSIDKGIGSIIPDGLIEGLIGYPYFCPDMIGGGEMESFSKNKGKIDKELFIRWAEASAFMPMMQYSFAPWRIDSATNSICRKYTDIHEKLGDYIYSLAEKAKSTGDPIMRPLFYQFPKDSLTYLISDQFMLGDRFLVAPIIKQGVDYRDVYLPKGTWLDYWNGELLKGDQTIRNYAAPLDKLPVFINIF